MTKVAKFDASLADAYAYKSIGANAAFAVEADIYLEQSKLDGLQALFDYTAGMLNLCLTSGVAGGGASSAAFENAWAGSWSLITDPMTWQSDHNTTPNVTMTGSTMHTIRLEMTNTSGTTWNFVMKIDGVALGYGTYTHNYSGFGLTSATNVSVAVGAVQSNTTPDDNAYYIYAVRAYNAATGGALIFSDDFSSGFSAWDGTFGTASVIDDPFGGGGGGGPTPVPQGAAHPPVLWRWVLCDLNGNPISIITGLVENADLLFLLNRPAVLTFDVPSDEPLINIQHTDGFPYLSCGDRMVKGYRKVSSGADETPGGWQLAYVGRTWILQDSGDGDSARTSVTCYDPLIDLTKRICRNSGGDRATDTNTLTFDTIPAQTIIKDLIDRTNSYAATQIATTGTFSTCSSQSTAYDMQYVMPAIVDLTATGTVDIVTTYLDSIIGVHMSIGAVPRRGSDKSASIIFGYDAPPRIASGFDRTLSMENVANDIEMFGANRRQVSTATDGPSQAKYGVYEHVDAQSEITNVGLLDALVTELKALLRNPNETISVIPAPHISPLPITDWNLGDSVTINAARTPFPTTREAVTGVQRIYGFRLNIESEAGERVAELIVSSQAE